MKNKEEVIKDLKQERGLLEVKRNKLESFLQKDNDVNCQQLLLMEDQLRIINLYINTLSMRIKDLLES